MRKQIWRNGLLWRKAWLLAPMSGLLLQAPGCTDALIGLTTLSSVVTAGGVIFLVSRVFE